MDLHLGNSKPGLPQTKLSKTLKIVTNLPLYAQLREFGQDVRSVTRKKTTNNHVVNMENRLSLQPPAEQDGPAEKQYDKSAEIESAIEDAMQRWISKAQVSNDARDRVAVANGISRGVFGSLHLGAGYCAENTEVFIGDISLEDIDQDDMHQGDLEQLEEFKRAA